MGDCERISACNFFTDDMEKKMPVMADIFKKNFCLDKHEDCAKNKLLSFLEEKKFDISEKQAMEIERIEPTIYPTHMERVNKLINF